MKPLRQKNRPVISYAARVDPASPEHAVPVDGYRDVWLLRGKYVAFVLRGDALLRSPAFSGPESAGRWATQIRQERELEQE